MSYEGDYAPLLMPAFARATGVPVDVQSLPWTAAHEKLLTAFAGGALPDVMMLPAGWVGEFAMIGALAPVDDVTLLSDLFPGTADACRHRGRAYAVPWAVAPQVQFFRRDLLADAGYASPPVRWDEWRAAGLAFRRRHAGRFYALMLLNWWDALFTFAGQLTSRFLVDRDTRGDFASPEFTAALAFYKSLFDDGLAPRVLSTEVPDPLGAFARAQFAVFPQGPMFLKDLERRRAEIAPGLWGTQRMPGPAGPGAASGISSTLAVTAQARDRARAFALVRYLSSPAAELDFQRRIGALPARPSAWGAPQLARDPVLAPFAAQLRSPAASPAIVEWERIRIEVQLVAERLVRGQVALADAGPEMNRRVDTILSKRRALVASGRLP